MQHLRVVDYQKLVVFPPDMDRNKLYYSLQALRLSLRKVIVKVTRVDVYFQFYSYKSKLVCYLYFFFVVNSFLLLNYLNVSIRVQSWCM